ncbi:MAG: aquaporin [Planctomycetaceae bacterium]|nr:aquaporin [Planctomycetaceae bacterium]
MDRTHTRLSRCLAEMLGTFMLVFVGTAAITVNALTNGAVSHTGICLAFGLVVLAIIYAIGDVSGAHINPAVTIAFCLARRFEAREVLPYIVFQIAGAIGASLVVATIFPNDVTLGETLPQLPDGQAFTLETTITFILMFIVLCVSRGPKERGITAGIAVGSAVTFLALVAGPHTGASMNPARTLGPALVSGNMDGLWLYMGATTLGAAIAVPVYGIIFAGKREAPIV